MSAREATTVARALALAALALLLVAAPAGGAPPAPNASFYGSLQDEYGAAAPAGTTVVAVAILDGDVVDRDELTTDAAGRYGGAGAFDEKLDVRSDADRVEFYLDSYGGTELTPSTTAPDSGAHEHSLVAPDGTFGGTPPPTSTTSTTNTTTTTSTTNTTTTTSTTNTTTTTSTTTTTTTTNETTTTSTTTTTTSTTSTTTSTSEATTATSADAPAANGTETRAGNESTTATAAGGGGGLLAGLPLLPLGGLLALLVVGGVAVRVVGTKALRAGAAAVVGSLPLGGGASGLVVANETGSGVRCRVRCRTPAETVLSRELRLDAGDETTVGDLPDEKCQVAVQLASGRSKTETFAAGTDGVTVHVTERGVRIT